MAVKKTLKKKRIVVSEDDNKENTPLAQLVNFGPVTLPELESVGFKTLGDLRALGWQEVCRKWVEMYPERLNANAFIGIIAVLEGIVWTKISAAQRAQAKALVKKIKSEF